MNDIELYAGDKPVNSIISMVNDLYKFREYKKLEQESLLVVISEYCRFKKIDTVEFCEELSDLPQMVNIVESDCIRNKYIRKDYEESHIKFEDI